MSETLAEMLEEALVGHDVDCTRDGNAVSLDDADLVLHAFSRVQSSHANGVVVQADFGAESPLLGEPLLWNSFAGVGEDEAAAEANAFMKFLLGPFHVLLAVFAEHACNEGGEVWSEGRDAAGRRWRICEAPLITQGYEDPAALPFDALKEAVVSTFLTEATGALHWVEVFFAFLDGEDAAADVQLDGSPWPGGAQALAEWDGPRGAGYRSGRYFFIARRDDEDEA